MKVVIKKLEGNDNNDWRDGYGVEIGDAKVWFRPGEPEDNTLYRDYSDVYNIPTLLQRAHEAGLRGEKLEFEEVALEDEE